MWKIIAFNLFVKSFVWKKILFRKERLCDTIEREGLKAFSLD